MNGDSLGRTVDRWHSRASSTSPFPFLAHPVSDKTVQSLFRAGGILPSPCRLLMGSF
jgi:hypothetical protein